MITFRAFHEKWLIFLFDFNQTLSLEISKENFMKIRQMGAELIHAVKTDGHKANCRFSQLCEDFENV
jgi:hypothetical protein